MNDTSRAYSRNDIIILFCVINIKQVQSLTEYTLEYIYCEHHDEEANSGDIPSLYEIFSGA